MKHYGVLEDTIRPARHRFATIVLIYLTEQKPVPPAVMDGFVKFERILDSAKKELDLWRPETKFYHPGAPLAI